MDAKQQFSDCPLPRSGWLKVGRCAVQTCTDRFGPEGRMAVRDRERAKLQMPPIGYSSPVTWPSQNPDSHEEHAPSRTIYHTVPSMQLYRNNLTALSQTRNLYFVAYQGRIFVYRPRAAGERLLTRHSDLQLVPRKTKVGLKAPGYIDRHNPHCINHIITGFLGQREVAVACYDNGEVVAYGVEEVLAEILARDANREVAVAQGVIPILQPHAWTEPFFRDNVGHSAWGLAVHSRSRLIAVSSNLHQVVVFAFALTDDVAARSVSAECEGCGDLEAQIRRRARAWRIVIVFGLTASNIPNLSFLEDGEGEAEKVCAIDIEGTAWIADIWKPQQPAVRMAAQPGSGAPFGNFGWGVVPLPLDSFLVVHRMDQLLGGNTGHPYPEGPPKIIDIQQLLVNLPDDPCGDLRRAGEAVAQVVRATTTPSSQAVVPQGIGALIASALSADWGSEAWASMQLDDATLQLTDAATDDAPMSPVTAEDPDEPMPMPDAVGTLTDEEESGVYAITQFAILNESAQDDESYSTEESAEDEIDNQNEGDEQDSGYVGYALNDQGQVPGQGEGSDPSEVSDQSEWADQLGEVVQGEIDEAQDLHVAIISEILAGQTWSASMESPADDLVDLDGITAEEHETYMGMIRQFYEEKLPEIVSKGSYTSHFFSFTTTHSGSALAGDNHYITLSIASLFTIDEKAQLLKLARLWGRRQLIKAQLAGRLVRKSSCCGLSFSPSKMGNVLLPMIYEPHDMTLKDRGDYGAPFIHSNSRACEFRLEEFSEISKRYRFLLTFGQDLVLLAPPPAHKTSGEPTPEVRCTSVLADRHTSQEYFWFEGTVRLNMLVHVAELNLVVVGSATGRVLLVTPTRLEGPNRATFGKSWEYGYRVDGVLPRRSDELNHRQDAKRPLHGLAVGPAMYGEGKNNCKGATDAGPKRYRVVLHYRSHDIFTYEVGRDKHDGRICIF